MGFPISTNVLLVEDNRINQAVITGILSSWGITIDIANDGAEALSLLKSSASYQIILMDCQMPNIDGYETTRIIRSAEIKGIPANIIIIAMTANTTASDKAKCFDAGMNDYLSKPIDAELLREKFRHWLGGEQELKLPKLSDVSAKITEVSPQDNLSASNNKDETWALNLLLKRVRNNQEMVKKLISMFIDDNSTAKETILLLIEQNKLVELAKFTHKIEGSAKNLNFNKLACILNHIGSDAKHNRIENLNKYYQQFIREYDKLMALLIKY